MPSTGLGPRLLLKRLREVMAQPETAQARLDNIVSLIAANMVAEVCSIYVMRSGHVLELYASEGLKSKAVHSTHMKVGEGLVGTIAATSEMLNLSNAQEHPAFKFMPETGEERYQSFLGVPLLRSGSSFGVLVVQNRVARQYSEEEEDAIQITAMLLAEIISSGELEDVAQDVEDDVAHIRSHQIEAETLAGGIALGHAVLHEPRVVISEYIASDIPHELTRIDEATIQLRSHVDNLLSGEDLALSVEYGEILETFRMFAYDRSWAKRIRNAVETGLTAEAAVERVQNENRARMMRQVDPYLRERMHDLDDLANRLLRILTGTVMTAAQGQLPDNAILIGRNMGPAELLDYDRSQLRGLILEEGSSNSHVAVVARALGVPAVGQASGIIDLIDTNDPVIVDGSSAQVHIRPSPDIVEAYREKVRFYAQKQESYRAQRELEPVTRDGQRIQLNINAGLLVDLPHIADSGADGIGLFRTELQFMMSRTLPRQDRQTRLYRQVMDVAGDKPVLFRSLDIGSDKVVPYLRSHQEDNPALGWRAVRMSLERSALLRLQVRALLAAADGRPLYLMFPMIADQFEFRHAKQLVERELAFFKKRGRPLPEKIELGIMLEVPSLLWQLDELLPQISFVSIGSNDLWQYLFAADRSDPRLAGRYDPLNVSMLRALGSVVTACERHKVSLGLCGEMAGKPVEALALMAIGLRSLSMSPASIGPTRSMILATDLSDLQTAMSGWLDAGESDIRRHLVAYANANDLIL